MVQLVPMTVNKNARSEFTVSWRHKHEQNHILFAQNIPHLAREEVLATMKSYNLCWKISINDRREYDRCSNTSLHESWYKGAELCRRLHCTEKEVKLLINSNSAIFTGCEFFYSHLHNPHSFNTNQVNGTLVQKKDGDFCTMNPDGHCCNVQTSTN